MAHQTSSMRIQIVGSGTQVSVIAQVQRPGPAQSLVRLGNVMSHQTRLTGPCSASHPSFSLVDAGNLLVPGPLSPRLQ